MLVCSPNSIWQLQNDGAMWIFFDYSSLHKITRKNMSLNHNENLIDTTMLKYFQLLNFSLCLNQFYIR